MPSVGLVVVGFVAGIIAGISPCILPVLPVVLVAGATGADPAARRRRSIAVVAGLVVAFSVLTLAGSAILSALGLPQDLLRDLGLIVLGLFGLGLLVPAVGRLVERPFARLRGPQPRASGSGFVLGLGLGAVFVPCAGPVLAAITVLGATHRVGFSGAVLTLAFALGAAVPLLVLALAGDTLVDRTRALRERAPLLRTVGGAVLVAMTLLIGFNLTDGLQRDLPGYTSALQHTVEGTTFATHQLQALTGNGGGSIAMCRDDAMLHDCGAAPSFRDIGAWLNTPGGKPLTLAGLRGKVVLVDFWTYSCINCQRTLPHVEAWYQRYRDDGLVVVGVHTPEFAFEHVVSNVAAATGSLHVTYPVAVDDGYGTWDAYRNEYWPAEYLVDASGRVRHTHFAEGGYTETESLIRDLLVAAHHGVALPPPTDLPDKTPTGATNPETYLGYERLEYLVGSTPIPDAAASYDFPAALPPGGYGLSGTWTIGSQKATAGSGARLELGLQARDVYLVLGGRGTVAVSLDGGPPTTVAVSGVPRLYTLVSGDRLVTGVLMVSVSPGVDAYDFTFG
jgi:cytochrome c biogenesis protein CcdA/thiol-disulfide isomerase/thioredoxin